MSPATTPYGTPEEFKTERSRARVQQWKNGRAFRVPTRLTTMDGLNRRSRDDPFCVPRQPSVESLHTPYETFKPTREVRFPASVPPEWSSAEESQDSTTSAWAPDEEFKPTSEVRFPATIPPVCSSP